MKPPSKTAPAPQHAGLRAPRCVTPTPSTWRRRVCRRLVRTERWITAQKRGTPQGGVGPLGTAWHNSRPKEGVAANRRREITPSKHAGENQRGAGGPAAAPAPTSPSRHSQAGARPATSGTNFPTEAGRRSAAPSPPRHKGMPRSPRSRCAESTSALSPARPLAPNPGEEEPNKPPKRRLRNGKAATANPQAGEQSNPDPRGEEKNKGKTSKNPGDLANSWLRWHRGIRSRAGA